MTMLDASPEAGGSPAARPRPRRLLWWSLLLILMLVAGTGVVIAVTPTVVDTTIGSRSEGTVPPDVPGLPGRAVPILDSPHIPVGQADAVRYNSVPATSGPHFAVPPATGIYEAPMPEGLQVHALEHGHVGVQYGSDATTADIEALRRIGARYPDDVFVAPYPNLGRGIALTAWGRIDTFDAVDEARVVAFIEALKGRYDHGWRTR